jgi:hypothetical protein
MPAPSPTTTTSSSSMQPSIVDEGTFTPSYLSGLGVTDEATSGVHGLNVYGTTVFVILAVMLMAFR